MTNVTQALLPLVPLIVEAPALTDHARRAWPWVRASLPFFAFVPAPTAMSPRQLNGAVKHPSPGISRTQVSSKRFSTVRPRVSAGRTANIGAPSTTSTRNSNAEGGRRGSLLDDPVAVSRRTVLKGVSVAWLAATLAPGFGMAGATAAEGGVEGGGGGGFGSKAFTKKSYDGFAEGYDDLDGGWAASAIGMEVWFWALSCCTRRRRRERSVLVMAYVMHAVVQWSPTRGRMP